jgi:hypothetical protein
MFPRGQVRHVRERIPTTDTASAMAEGLSSSREAGTAPELGGAESNESVQESGGVLRQPEDFNKPDRAHGLVDRGVLQFGAVR